MKKKQEEIAPQRISVDIKLPSGSKIGVMTVCSDLDEINCKEEVIMKMVKESIYGCIDHLFMAGVHKIYQDEISRGSNK